MKTKQQTIFDHLKKRSITKTEAAKKYNITSLSQIISKLRATGCKIRTDMVPFGNRFIARYTLS